MTGRVLDFVRSSHRRTQELLPWFLNGTLEGEEAQQVEQHLQECPACQSELECLIVLRSDYVESELAPEAKGAFARLRPRLMDEAAPTTRAPRRPPSRGGWAVASCGRGTGGAERVRRLRPRWGPQGRGSSTPGTGPRR